MIFLLFIPSASPSLPAFMVEAEPPLIGGGVFDGVIFDPVIFDTGNGVMTIEDEPLPLRIVNEAEPDLVDAIDGNFNATYFDPAYFDTLGVFSVEAEPPSV